MDNPGSPPPGNPGGSFYARTFTIATVAVFAALLYQLIEPLLRPLVWAAFLGFLMQPLQARLTRALRGRGTVAAGLLTLATVLLVVVPLTLLGAAFATQAVDLALRLQESAGKLTSYNLGDLSRWPPAGRLLDWLAAHASFGVAEIQAWAVEGAKRLLHAAASTGGSLVLGAAATVLSFTVMLFVLFFFLRDGSAMARMVTRLIPMTETRKHIVANRLTAVTRAVVLGTVLTAMVQGVLLGIGLSIAGVPAPVVFGVLGAVLSVVPFGGTAIVWVPSALWLFAQGDIGHFFFLAAWGLLVVSTVDNFMKPMLISGQANVPTLAVFVGVLGGLASFGLIGMFIGPVIIAVALTLLEFAHESLSPPRP